MTDTTSLIDACNKDFESYFGERGWDLRKQNNPSGFVEYKDQNTDHLWIGWKAAWELQDARADMIIASTEGTE